MPPVPQRPSNPWPSACGLQEIVNKINDSVKKRGMKINVGKTEMMAFERGDSTTECDIFIEGEKVEQVKELVYLERCGLKKDVVTKVERGMLLWFGHRERRNESRLTKQIYRANDTVSVHRPSFYAQRFLDFMGKTVFKKIPSQQLSYGQCTVQRTKLCCSELPANDAMRSFSAPRPCLLSGLHAPPTPLSHDPIRRSSPAVNNIVFFCILSVHTIVRYRITARVSGGLTLKHSPSKRKSIARPARPAEEVDTPGRMYIGKPIKDYDAEEFLRNARLSPRSSLRSSRSDFTDTTISTWNQRHNVYSPRMEYPSVLSDKYRIFDRDRINTFQRRIDFDTSNLTARDPGPSFISNYRNRDDRMESLSDQLTKVLSTGAGSSHINGSLADSGIQTDNTSTSAPHIYISEAPNYVTPLTPTKKDAAVDTRNENNLQEIPFIDDDDDRDTPKFYRRRTNLLEKHKSMSNIPERIDEVSSKEQSNERLSSSLNRSRSPTFVDRFKKFFMDIGLVRTSDTDIVNRETLPKTIHSSYRQHARSVTPTRSLEVNREASTLPKDMRFRKVRSTQAVYIKQDSPLILRKNLDANISVSDKDHVSVVQVNGEERIEDSTSEKLIRDFVYIKTIDKAEIYSGKDSGSTIIVVPPAD
ncbi:Phosphatidylinositol 4-phosphate 5-kinase type-1 beta [Eumeta japonica]|uniref:Phosphatidylinositol 4-phosphate 5-kinase type-1 beta n=1 Tax=Eumeta variegata TaxID=151549 RepID=A0A4C1TNW8_EUMVA|nr:Phosphatidylinositol 4-phosphate 5-kinase type-1 beta [Eumeta japonica]